jgi:hypothetical protein
MAEEIRLDVVARGHNRGLDETSRALRGVKAESDKTAKSFKETSDASFDLDRAAAEAREEIERLQESFRRTGDRSLLREIRAQKRDLDEVAKVLAAVGGGGGRGAEAAFDLGGAGLRPRNALIAGVVGALVAAAPTIGAMLGGLVAGSIGTIGVAGGLAMAAKNPRVQAEARRFGASISREFFRGGDVFEGPAISAMRELEGAFKDMNVPAAFAKMAPHVQTIAEGLGALGRNIMPGLNAAFDKMGPFAEAAAQGFADMGRDLGGFMKDVTDSEGAVSGLTMAFAVINGIIRVTGSLIEFLSDAWMKLVRAQIRGVALAQGFAAATGQQGLAGDLMVLQRALLELLPPTERNTDASRNATGAVQSFGVAADVASSALGHLGGALDDAHSKFLDWAGAEIHAAQALRRMKEALDESNGSTSLHTEKGLAAREAVLRFAEAARTAAAAKLEETQSIKAADAVYEEFRQQLIATLIATGHTRKEAEKLARQWMAYAKMPDITKTITIIHNDEYRRHRAGERESPERTSMGRPFAAGGVTPAFEPFRVHDGETLWSSRQHFVATRSQTESMSGGGRTRPLILQASDPIMQLAFNWIVGEVGRRGGTLAAIGIRDP